MEPNTDPKRHRDDKNHGTKTDQVFRCYNCIICNEGFSSAQALGGHMNLHRRDREKLLKQPLPQPYFYASDSFLWPSYRPSSLMSCVPTPPSLLMPRDHHDRASVSAWASSSVPSNQLHFNVSATDLISSYNSSSWISCMPPSSTLMERIIPDGTSIPACMHSTYCSTKHLPLLAIQTLPLQQAYAPTGSSSLLLPSQTEMRCGAGVSAAAGDELDLELRLGPNPHASHH